jgi:hypothetical protein
LEIIIFSFLFFVITGQFTCCYIPSLAGTIIRQSNFHSGIAILHDNLFGREVPLLCAFPISPIVPPATRFLLPPFSTFTVIEPPVKQLVMLSIPFELSMAILPISPPSPKSALAIDVSNSLYINSRFAIFHFYIADAPFYLTD